MKKQITLRIDSDVLDWFRAFGRGYQSQINKVLKHHVATSCKPTEENVTTNKPKRSKLVSDVATKYSQKYREQNPMERCVVCGKALKFNCGH